MLDGPSATVLCTFFPIHSEDRFGGKAFDMVAGSIETGSFHPLLLSRLRVFTQFFKGVLFYGRFFAQ